MKIKNPELEQRIEHFTETLRSAGVKLTHQRLEIYKEIASSEDHPDAETVYQAVRQRLPMVSLDTVYRTMKLLSDLELISTLGPRHEAVRFDANLQQHHHFHCVRCGLVRDFESKDLDAVPIPDVARAFGDIETVQIDIRGVCKSCLKQE